MAAIAKWIGKSLGFAAIAVASGIAGVEKARSSIPKSPENPELIDLLVWVVTLGDPLALLAALIAAACTWVSLYTFIAERPATRKDLEEVIQPLDSTVEELGGQVWAEGQVRDAQHAATLAGQQATRDHTDAATAAQTKAMLEALARDKHDQAIKDIVAGRVDEVLRRRYLKALGIERGDGTKVTEREAAEFAIAAENAAQSDDPRIREIADLIDAGKIVEASERKAEIAEETIATAANELRDAARLALPVSPSKAMEHFKRATDIDPTDLSSWIGLGRLQMRYVSFDSAESSFESGLKYAKTEPERLMVHEASGDLFKLRGDLDKANEEHEAASAIAESLAKSEPENIQWQRLRTGGYLKLGDLQVEANNRPVAFKHYHDAIGNAERLRTKHPTNADLLRDWCVCLGRLGDLHLGDNNTASARKYFEALLAPSKRLAELLPKSLETKRDLSIAYHKLGDLEDSCRDFPTAKKWYNADLAVTKELAALEPDNAQYKNDLALTNTKLGLVLENEGLPDDALGHFHEAERILSALTKQWPDLAEAVNRLRNVRIKISQLKG